MSSHIENSHAYVKPESIAFKTVFLDPYSVPYFFLAARGPCCCMYVFSSCGEQGPLSSYGP